MSHSFFSPAPDAPSMSMQFLPTPQSGHFDRQTDPAIVKISSKGVFSRAAAEQKLQSVVEAAGITSGGFTIEADPVGKEAAIRFAGSPEEAALMVKKVFNAQRIDKTTWKQNHIVDTDGAEVPAYINPDKSHQTIKTEIATKRLQDIFRSTYPGKSFECRSRAEGVISCSWMSLARVVCPTRSETLVKWNPAAIEKHEIDKPGIINKFEAAFGASTATEWV